MTLNHVHLGAKDIAQSVKFYTSVFEFKKNHEHGSGVFLQNTSGFLLAIDPVEELPKFPRWYHLGFCLDSEQEALAMYKKCKSLDVRFTREIIHEKGEFASFFISDPDENRIEVSWHNE